MMWPVQDLARVYASMQHAVASAERVFSLIDAVPEVTDREGAVDPGTIRGDLSNTFTENLIHGSDSPESAAREIALFFPGLS